MSLQIGDATRQRIEHTEEAASLFLEILASGGDWRGLDDSERQELVATGCKLQAMLLDDAAVEFDRDVATVLTSLQELASDAREIVRLGSSALGATDRRGNSFLLELESDVSAARGLLEGFKTSDTSANDMMASVLDAATRLTTHIGTIQSLEADIRIMGFNTTLKCARLGDVGRGLSVIAHELRAHSHRTAVEAEAITGDVDAIIGAAKALGGRDQAQRAEDIAAIVMAMSDSITQLKAAGDNMASALHSLMADGDTVASLLDETVTRMAGHKEIGAALRAASAGFEKLSAALPPAGGSESEARTRMLAQLAKSYTMAREREVHALITGTAPASGTSAPHSVDDMLF
jgi:methyl-accepting chemotaxis protein